MPWWGGGREERRGEEERDVNKRTGEGERGAEGRDVNKRTTYRDVFSEVRWGVNFVDRQHHGLRLAQ